MQCSLSSTLPKNTPELLSSILSPFNPSNISTDDRRSSPDRSDLKTDVIVDLGCKRKVGLIGFRCRCGEMFCFEHRYSDRHDCSYDYKAAGREAIGHENPVVRASKILKV
ncbi:hypothetical protein QVD17_31954 [Tagetes erecta]|uniref:AN1-type domain-containing protein n=1 Tax=Tagetes erecta TaxID=13708 RepID=A0AAD8K761_TARER|nr:hypothetical protein QVD17_31954 [Tagetes erecta]